MQYIQVHYNAAVCVCAVCTGALQYCCMCLCGMYCCTIILLYLPVHNLQVNTNTAFCVCAVCIGALYCCCIYSCTVILLYVSVHYVQVHYNAVIYTVAL